MKQEEGKKTPNKQTRNKQQTWKCAKFSFFPKKKLKNPLLTPKGLAGRVVGRVRVQPCLPNWAGEGHISWIPLSIIVPCPFSRDVLSSGQGFLKHSPVCIASLERMPHTLLVLHHSNLHATKVHVVLCKASWSHFKNLRPVTLSLDFWLAPLAAKSFLCNLSVSPSNFCPVLWKLYFLKPLTASWGWFSKPCFFWSWGCVLW